MGRVRQKKGSKSASVQQTVEKKTMDHYCVMGLHEFASSLDAKRAYHRLALLWHPDRQMHLPEERRKSAEDKFKRINEAYAVLGDDARKRDFDCSLRNELPSGARGNVGSQESVLYQNTSYAGADTKQSSKDFPRGGGTPVAATGHADTVRLVMCPGCGTGAQAKAGKKGGPTLECLNCGGSFHEVFCAGCKDWGATKGRRGESTMRCGCGNVFCQSRCPSCSRWNTYNGEAQGAKTRSCGYCARRFHEAFCPACSRWGIWGGDKGCRSLSCDCGKVFYEICCRSCAMWGSVKGHHAEAQSSLSCGTCGFQSHEAFCPSCGQWDSFPGAKGSDTLTCRSPRCRVGEGRQKGKSGRSAGARFFQVFCAGCSSWRSVLGEKTAVGATRVKCEGCNSTFRVKSCPSCGNWEQSIAGTRENLNQRGESWCSSCGLSPTSRLNGRPEQATCPEDEKHDRAETSGVELNSLIGAAAMAVAAGGTPNDAGVPHTLMEMETLPAAVIQQREAEPEHPGIEASVEKKRSNSWRKKNRHSKQNWVLTSSPENGSEHYNDECRVGNSVDETTGTEIEVQQPAAQMCNTESPTVVESVKMLLPHKQPWCFEGTDYLPDEQDSHSENVPPEVRSTDGILTSCNGKILNSEGNEVTKKPAGGNGGITVDLTALRSSGSPADESTALSVPAVSAVDEELLSRHPRTQCTQLAPPRRYQSKKRGSGKGRRPAEIQRRARRPDGPTAAGRLGDGGEMDIFERVEESGAAGPASVSCGNGSDAGDRRSLESPEEADNEMGKTECNATGGLDPKTSRDTLEFKRNQETSDTPAACSPVAANIPSMPEDLSKSYSRTFRHSGSRPGFRCRRGVATGKPKATISDEVDKSGHTNGEVKTVQRDAECSVVSDIAPVHLAVAAPREDGPPPPPEPRYLQYSRENTRRENYGGGSARVGAGSGGSRGGGEEVGEDGGKHGQGRTRPNGLKRSGKRSGAGDRVFPGSVAGPDVIHLAFCSRCQGYQSWRGPMGDGGRRRRTSSGQGSIRPDGEKRRCCGECGDVFCNVSYYPTR